MHDPLLLELWWPLKWNHYSQGRTSYAFPTHHPCVRRVILDRIKSQTRFYSGFLRGGGGYTLLHVANECELITVRSILLHLASDDYFRSKPDEPASTTR